MKKKPVEPHATARGAITKLSETVALLDRALAVLEMVYAQRGENNLIGQQAKAVLDDAKGLM